MQKLLYLILLLPALAFAQKGNVERVYWDPKELVSGSQKLPKDAAGQRCAILKVNVYNPEGVFDNQVTFTGDFVGEPVNNGTEWLLYLPTSTKMISLQSPTLAPVTLDFSEYDLKLQSTCTYKAEIYTFGPKGKVTTPTHSFRLSVVPGDAAVYVDNKPYTAEEGRVDIPLAPGSHHYAIMSDGYVTEAGKIAMHDRNISMTVRLKSENGSVVEPFRHTTGKYGFRDQNKKTIVKPEFDKVFAAGDLYWVTKNGKYGMFDNQGNQLAHFAYDQVTKANQEGVFVVTMNCKYGIVDNKGRQTVPCTLDRVSTTSSSLIVLIENGRFGAVDAAGQLVVPCIYDEIADFSQGRAAIQENGKCGFINEEGEVVIPCVYDTASHFAGGKARVSQGIQTFFIDRDGNRVAD